MAITRRFAYLLSGGVLLLIPAALLHVSLTIFVLYNMVCFSLLIIDYFVSAFEPFLSAERCGEENFSLYERETVNIQVHNKSGVKLHLELKDEAPDLHFKVESPLMKGFVGAHERKLFEYWVTPTKRGSFSFGSVHVKCGGRLGLCMRLFRIDLKRQYKVYPNMKNLRKYRLGICNNRLFRQGQRSLAAPGHGTSFESVREYLHGDDYRKINWKATARISKPMLNQYEPEKNQHVYILLDTGRPMGLTIRGNRKLDLAVNTALVLIDVINQNGDLSALMNFNTSVDSMILPGKGIDHRKQLFEALYNVECTKHTSNFDEAFLYFKKKERHRSILFIFTDFETVEEAEYLIRVLPIISRNNIVVIPLIKNESQQKIISAEARDQQELFNKGVALELADERRRIVHVLNRKGVFCFECSAEKLEYNAVNKYIQVKNRTYL